jgi:putative transposase
MRYNPDIHRRRSIRLKGYDYSRAGLYFVTICTQNRLCLFGGIEHGKMVLNDAGKMVERQWQESICRFDDIKFMNLSSCPIISMESLNP